jgi:hypothetical protein
VTSLPNIPTQECFMSSNPLPVGSWNEKVIDEACLLKASSLSGLNSHWGAAKGSHLMKMGL